MCRSKVFQMVLSLYLIKKLQYIFLYFFIMIIFINSHDAKKGNIAFYHYY